MKQDLVWYEPQTPEEIMEQALKTADKFFVLFSGGQDSVCVADYVSRKYPDNFAGVVFTNTGMGSAVTRNWVIDYCKERNWRLDMTWPSEKDRYYNLVMEYGFPKMSSHKIVMGRLKFHSWYYFLKRKCQRGKKLAYISGVRKKESWARDKVKFYSKKPIDINATLTFVKPFLYKNGSQLQEYFIKNGLKKSPAYEWFDKSGECWCGCYYHPWELKMLEKHDPFMFDTIQWMEKQVRLYGSKTAKLNPRWGRSVGADMARNQMTIDGDYDEHCTESCDT